MPDISDQGFVTRETGVNTTTIIGTAVGTVTVSKYPGFLKGLLVNNRVASAQFVLYNSVGTSANILGTLTMGTNTADDPPPFYDFPTKFNALTIASTTANSGAIAFWNVGV